MNSAIAPSGRTKFEAVGELLALLGSDVAVAASARRICQLACEHSAARAAIVCLRDPEGRNLQATASPGESSAGPAALQSIRFPKNDAVSGCFRSAQMARCDAAGVDPAIRCLVPEEIASFVLLPIIRNDHCTGVLALGVNEPLLEDDARFVTTLAGVAGLVLFPEEPDRHAFERIRAAVDTVAGLRPQAGLADIKKTIVNATRSALDADQVALFTIDPCMGGVECECTSEVPESLQRAFWEIYGNLATDREHLGAWVETDIGAESHGNGKARAALAESGVRGIVACPVRSEVGATGILVAFYNSTIKAFYVRAGTIESIAAQAASTISYSLAIEQSRYLLDDLAGANQELSIQATMDGLTGLANHRTMQQKLADLCRRSSSTRDRGLFSLVMIDVDHFKFYNDTHGHPEGDAALRGVARVVAAGLRQEDFAARYGGEEFALVLSGVKKDAARSVADRIRRAVADHMFPKGHLTVSMGIAEFPADGDTPSEIIDRSDRALYHAKITGRNRIVEWGSAGCSEADGESDPYDTKGPNRAVMIVEMQAGSGKSLREMLSSEVYSVELSRSREAAAELLKTCKYDIVLVSGSGQAKDYKCVSTVAAIRPNMPVVLITDDLSVEGSRDALRSGASDVFLRPTNPAELPLVIERNLERARVEKQRLAHRSTGVMLQAIEALVAAIDAKDPFTAGHSIRVTSFALAIADHLDISSEDRWVIELAARLHDVGKLGLPDSALNKQSPLTEDEWRAMREHPALGSRIVGAIDELAYVSTIIRHHHERLDGTGYPDGLKGESIPYLAQVIAVADAYEAMTSERAHRSPLTPDEAIEELRLHARTYYAPDIVEVLASFLRDSASGADDANAERAA